MKKIFLWLLVIIVVGLTAVYFVRNIVVAWSIEEGGAYAMGVKTHLGSANLSLGAGKLELNNYKIENPEGYPDNGLISIDYGLLAVNTGSVFAGTVEIDSLILNGINVNLIQNNNQGNFMEVMKYARSINYDTSSGTTIVKIKNVAVRNVAITASLKIMNSVNIDKAFTIEDIHLTNIGGDNGASIGEVTSIILREILNKAVIKGQGQLPDQFGKSLEKLEKGVTDKAGEEAVNRIKDVGSSLLDGDKK